MDFDETLSSHNLPFLEALYETYQSDPDAVDPQWRAFLEQPPGWLRGGDSRTARAMAASHVDEAEQVALQARVDKLIEHYRLHGHLGANIDPLERRHEVGTPALDPAYFGLDQEHLEWRFNPGTLFRDSAVPLRDIIDRLQRTYCRHIGVEYWHITDLERRSWLQERMESCENEVVPERDEQMRLLRSLAACDNVDKFLHSKFIGAKRFSISGAESLLALLETLIEDAGDHGISEVVMGMAHRGRLAVMMNILGKTPAEIIAEFESGDPWLNLGSGDVKYHKGTYRNHVTRRGQNMYLALTFNPSHLEAITPVVAGRVRAKQDYLNDTERSTVLGVTMHGDAAVAAQGVYAETLNLSRLPGYTIGGSIRVVINNQIGFTTNPSEARSTIYCTAVADMLNVPIFHVNGDDPEAAAYVAKLAVAYRQQFKTDVIIDLVCYRKYGHNEGDEPTFTQPSMYRQIEGRPSVRDRYQHRLLARGTTTQEDCDAIDRELREQFEEALQEVRRTGADKSKPPMHGIWAHFRGGPERDVPDVDTHVTSQVVDTVRKTLTTVPDGFSIHRKVTRMIDEVGEMLKGGANLSWAAAEHLAYGSLLLEGSDVRISGQDSIRGTFNHRHAAWVDTETDERYFPLRHLDGKKGNFEAYNSPLSEFAVLGFEYGYSLAAPHALIIWEAQFGDFVNGAQVIVDQFLSSSEDKWNRLSGLTLFLPHGYEGQGPEHSSARLERFLQLSAEDNIQVCNPTTPVQLFHMLRRQVRRNWRKPLVVMTPKSLLRTRASFSPLEEFLRGSFHRVIDDQVDPAKVRRLMFCSGRLYYDLVAEREQRQRWDVAIVRIEQLYPFPNDDIAQIFGRYEKAEKVLWVQDEPSNMGAWFFVRHLLASHGRGEPQYVGRAESASPATGTPESHKLEHQMMMDEAFEDSEKS